MNFIYIFNRIYEYCIRCPSAGFSLISVLPIIGSPVVYLLVFEPFKNVAPYNLYLYSYLYLLQYSICIQYSYDMLTHYYSAVQHTVLY